MAKTKPVTVGRMARLVRDTERASPTGATGQTILKFTGSPIDRLVHDKRIGPVELIAAHDLHDGYMAITGHLWLRAVTLERVDASGGGGDSPPRIIDAQRRYKAFAGHWSMMAKRGDRTLRILIDAVVDERPLRIVEDDLGIRHGLAAKAVVRGLRDYAARAGWVDPTTRAQWLADAGNTFHTLHPALSLAIAAAKR